MTDLGGKARLERMPLSEFVEIGGVAEVNRRILHPVGLALGYETDDATGEITGLFVAQDDDPEGFIFGENCLGIAQKQVRWFARERRWRKRRRKALGFTVQPPARL